MPTACNTRTGNMERGRVRTAGGSCPSFWLQFCPVSTCRDSQQDDNDLEALLGNRSRGWMSERALFHLADELAFHRGREGMKPRAGTWHSHCHRPLLGFPAAWLLPRAPTEAPIFAEPWMVDRGQGQELGSGRQVKAWSESRDLILWVG